MRSIRDDEGHHAGIRLVGGGEHFRVKFQWLLRSGEGTCKQHGVRVRSKTLGTKTCMYRSRSMISG